MYISFLTLAAFCTYISFSTAAATPKPYFPSPKLPETPQLTERQYNSSREHNSTWRTYNKYAGYSQGSCRPENMVYRREWRTLSKAERKSYINAVRCLQTKAPSLHKGIIPGASSRYDDFQIVHINQTWTIHFNAPFLGWHRWFTWTYEQNLKKECGYKGVHPYWDWSLDSEDVEASPIFDGSEYSMSGNGEAIPHEPLTLFINLPPVPLANLTLPVGTGGGCVTTGPFANHTVNFGHVGSLLPELRNNPANLAYKPHCMKRDFNPILYKQSASPQAVAELLASPNASVFNDVIEFGSHPGIISIHGIGHLGTGGEMPDAFSSPGDPIFFMHHAQIDRLWTIWQSQDPATRQYAVSGPRNAQNYPAGPDFKADDLIDLGVLSPGGPRPFWQIMDTTKGPFCYGYK